MYSADGHACKRLDQPSLRLTRCRNFAESNPLGFVAHFVLTFCDSISIACIQSTTRCDLARATSPPNRTASLAKSALIE